MAQQRVVEFFEKEYASFNVPNLIASGGEKTILDVTWRTVEVVSQFKEAMKDLIEPLVKSGDVEKTFLSFAVSDKRLKKIVESLIKDIKAGNSSLPPVLKSPKLKVWNPKKVVPGTFRLRRASGGAGITFRHVSSGSGTGTGANETIVRSLNTAMRDALYSRWLDTSTDLFNKPPKTGDSSKKAMRSKMQTAHEHNTTIGAMMLGMFKKMKPNLYLKNYIVAMDVIKELENSIQLDYGRNFKQNKSTGGFKFDWFIKTSIRKNFAGSEMTDISRMKDSQYGEGNIRKAVNKAYRKKYTWLGAALFKMAGSKSAKDQATEGAISNIMKPLTKSGRPDMRFTVNKKAKDFKPTKDSFKGKRSKTAKLNTKIMTVAVAGTAARRPQKKKREDNQSLLKLETLINKRLPAEVRRNMGRPALINQTGRFSNSVEMQNLRQTEGGISGEYTYQLRPYETFENTGSRRWPAGYNPKPLIAKSIRKLALQYTEQKFTHLRRT